MLDGILSEGYGIIPKKFIRLKTLSPYSKLVACYLLSYTGGGNKVCYPSQKLIAEDLCISERSVIRALQELIDQNFIIKDKLFKDSKFNTSNKYIVTIIESVEDLKNYMQMTDSHMDVTDSHLDDNFKNGVNSLPENNIIKSSQVTVSHSNNTNNNNNNTYSQKNEIEYSEEIETLYKLYPSKCPIGNRSTGKSTKDKQIIKRLLSSVEYSVLRETIELYLRSCSETKCYVKNFKTFLNNLPDVDSLRSTAHTNTPAPGPSISEIEFQEQRRQEFLDSLKRGL